MKKHVYMVLSPRVVSKKNRVVRSLPFVLFILLLFHAGIRNGIAQTNNYFGTSGTVSGSVWSTNVSGPYNSALNTSGGAVLNFNNAGSLTWATISSYTALNFNAQMSWSNAGTLGLAGTNVILNTAAGINIDPGGSQSYSTSATAAFTKNGSGSFASVGGTFGGGFTLNAGTLIARGVNAFGNGSLTMNGGCVAGSANRDFTGKLSTITVGGDVQFGEVPANIALASGSANLTFDAPMALGNQLRTLTLGGSGTITLGGVISNSGSNGLTFTANSNGTGRFDITNTANTFSGPININGNGTGIAEVRFTSDGSLGNSSNSITIDGGRFGIVSGGTVTISSSRSIYVGSTAGTSISAPGATGSLIYNGVIADKSGSTGMLAKQGAGTLTLGGSNTYTGATYINNGTLKLSGGIDRLPTGTVLYLGQAASTNLGTFDLNGNNQTIAGLSSTGGTNASASKNTITSASAAILTLNATSNYSYSDGTAANSGTITGAVSLIKNGTGTQSFGETNTYTGKTTINAGYIAISGESFLGSNPGSFTADQITLNGGGIKATGNITFSSNRGITLGTSGGTFDAGSSTITALNAITGSGSLTKLGNGTLNLTGQHTYTGNTIVSAGTLQLSNASGSIPNTNSITVNGGTLQVSANQTLNNLTLTLGNVVLDAGVTLTINGTLTLTSCSFSGTGTIVYGSSGTLVYNGASAQTTSGYEWPSSSGPINVTVGDQGVTLHAARSLSGVLTLNGKLTTSATNLLTLLSTASTTGVSSTSFVNGPLAKNGSTDFVFPIGKGSVLGKAAVRNLTGSVTFTAEYFNTGHPDSLSLGASLTGGRVSSIEYWDLSPDNSVSANVDLYWQHPGASGIASTTSTELVVAHYTGGQWISEGNSGVNTSGNTGNVSSNTVSSWSPFTFGSPTGNNPLPVKFLSFDVKPSGNYAQLSWSTATEKNSDKFVIERTDESASFQSVGEVKAAGQSLNIKQYYFTDKTERGSRSCYRIKEVDFDGSIQYTDVKCLDQKQSLTIMPVPFTTGLTISGSNGLEGTVYIYDIQGREVASAVLNRANRFTVNISTESWAKGLYTLVSTQGLNTVTHRVVKQVE